MSHYPSLAAENRSRDISAERERLQSDIEHLNREIEYEERNKEEQRVRFAEDLGAQIERREEIVQNVEKRADLQELAEKFDQWKLEEIDAKELEVTVSFIVRK